MNNSAWSEAQDIFIDLTTSKTTNFDNNYWGTNDPINGSDYKYSWADRVSFNNFTNNPVKWITQNNSNSNNNGVNVNPSTNSTNPIKTNNASSQVTNTLNNLAKSLNSMSGNLTNSLHNDSSQENQVSDSLNVQTNSNVGANPDSSSSDSKKYTEVKVNKTNDKNNNDNLQYFICAFIVLAALVIGFYMHKKY